jgi:hypothetical protein
VIAASTGTAAALLITFILTQTGRSDVNDDPVTISHPSPEALKAVLDSAPRPPGARLIDEHVEVGQGDATTNVTRTYRLTGAQPACVQLINAVESSGWIAEDRLNRPLDPGTCDPSASNPIYTDPGNDVQRRGRLRPAGGATGSIRVEWRRDWLLYSLDEGDLPA